MVISFESVARFFWFRPLLNVIKKFTDLYVDERDEKITPRLCEKSCIFDMSFYQFAVKDYLSIGDEKKP